MTGFYKQEAGPPDYRAVDPAGKVIPLQPKNGVSIPDSFSEEKAVGNRNPKQPEQARWLAVPISQLVVDTELANWYWHGYAGAQLITLFTGLWKSGKSTLLSALLKALDGEDDRFCGQEVTPTKVLVITEETSRKWVERRDILPLGDHVHMICKPFLMPSNKTAWLDFLTKVATQVRTEQYGLVIFDSIFNLWPVQDENNAPEVRDALMPLNMTIEAGAGILLAAHPKKGDASEGQATRGTGALPAYVDVILEMRRFDAERHGDTKRVLTTFSRYDETPPELVIEYNKDTHQYCAVGSRADVKQGERLDLILRVLPNDGVAYTVDEILQNWPVDEGIRPGHRTLQRDLDYGMRENLVHRRGVGVKGDQYRFFRV